MQNGMIWYSVFKQRCSKKLKWCIYSRLTVSPGEGEIPYKSDGKAHRKIKMKLLRDTKVGGDQALTDPNKGDYSKAHTTAIYVSLFMYIPISDTWMGKYSEFRSQTS